MSFVTRLAKWVYATCLCLYFTKAATLLPNGHFEQIASLSGGAYCQFDSGSAKTLRDLLAAVAVYAVGGRRALENFHRRVGRTMLRLAPKNVP